MDAGETDKITKPLIRIGILKSIRIGKREGLSLG
jgi:hypothetical protein